MASGGTKIAWANDTWNPLRARHKVTGEEGWACVKVSPGCANCYAKVLNKTRRFGRGTGLDYTVPDLARVDTYIDDWTLAQPMRWKRPRRIFVCSMTDLFGEWVTDEQLDRIFAVMALTPHHTYQVLSKRPQRMREYLRYLQGQVTLYIDRMTGEHPELYDPLMQLADEGSCWPPLPNVWLGVSVEDQAAADERIPLLLDTPAAVRFISAEPLLGPVDLRSYLGSVCSACGEKADAVKWANIMSSYHDSHVVGGAPPEPCCPMEHGDSGLSWVIVGGESGPGWRPMEHKWVASIRDQCAAAGVAYFGKQGAGARSGIALPSPLNEQAWPEVT